MKTQIQVKQGILEGEAHHGYVVFKGVPYAKPPIGNLRWREPQEPETWEGIRKADRFANIPIQELPDPENPFTGRYAKEFYSDPNFLPEMSEDCLYLNIWMPDHKEQETLPVAFWIHGGGFGGGYSSEIEFDGEAYCRKGVILVSVEYRVNIFGFLAHPWLDAESEKGVSGNYGILDQIAALRWVRENIAAFGGDAERITVFGQSAGSMSTQVLSSSPLTKGIFSGAILQSGISCREDILLTPDLEEEEKYGERFVELTGAKSLEELRNLPVQKITEAAKAFEKMMWNEGKGVVLVPNVDGYVLKRSVKQVWENGEMHRIPYMAGAVLDDLGSAQGEVKKETPGKLMEECCRWSRKCQEIFQIPSYLYFFSHKLPGDDWGAFHSSELWYMFGTYGRSWRPMEKEDRELSEKMIEYWTQFVKTGKPDMESENVWRPYTDEDQFIMKFQ